MFRSCNLDHGRGPGGHGKGDCDYQPAGWHEDWHDISSEDGTVIAGNYEYEEGGIVNQQDAEYIVMACNAYPDLQSRLDSALESLKDVVQIIDYREHAFDEPEQDDGDYHQRLHDWLPSACAILSGPEEKETTDAN